VTLRFLIVRGVFTTLVCAGALCVPAPVPALAAGRVDDATATRAYLRASEEYARDASAEVGASVAAIAARANEIAGACPSALTYAPRDMVFREIGYEVYATLFYAGLAPMRTRMLGFARAIDRLSWSDRRLTRLVHAQAAAEVAITAVAQPDVCADIEAWQASAYATLPRSATGFIARVETIEYRTDAGPFEESRAGAITRLLRRYEGPRERRTAKRVIRQERRTERKLGVATEAVPVRLASALGVSAL
jgi:hypothetical protein